MHVLLGLPTRGPKPLTLACSSFQGGDVSGGKPHDLRPKAL